MPAAAADISIPRGWLHGNITANERRRGGRTTRCRGHRCLTAAANITPCGRPRECVAADKRRGGEGERRPAAADASQDTAAGRPRRLAPRANGCGGVSPQASGGEGRGSGSLPPRMPPARGRCCGDHGTAAESVHRADSGGGVLH